MNKKWYDDVNYVVAVVLLLMILSMFFGIFLESRRITRSLNNGRSVLVEQTYNDGSKRLMVIRKDVLKSEKYITGIKILGE